MDTRTKMAFEDWSAWTAMAGEAVRAGRVKEAAGYNDEADKARDLYFALLCPATATTSRPVKAARRAPVRLSETDKLIARWGTAWAERIKAEGAPIGRCCCGEPVWCGEAVEVHIGRQTFLAHYEGGCAPVGATSDYGRMDADGLWHEIQY